MATPTPSTPMPSTPMPGSPAFATGLRTPAAAAVAGLIFSVVLISVLVLLHTSVPAGSGSAEWLQDPGRRAAVSTAVALIPFAGISFLWFIGVVRSRLGALEDRLFATVFLGSGLVFVGLLFTSSAFLATGLVLFDRGVVPQADTMVALQVLTRQLMGAFGARMAAVFTISVASVAMRTGVLPRWLVAFGYVVGLALLATPPLTRWAQLAFPTWVLVVSVHLLVASRRERTSGQGS